jgi:hypothetical protein
MLIRLACLPYLCAAFLLAACGGTMGIKKPEQGLAGAFITYGPPEQIDCAPRVTQAEKDSCKRENQRVIEEPFQGTLTIRNLGTREKVEQALDSEGKFRVLLDPGQYEVCLNGECSDPLEVRMGRFATYGQRLPRPAPDSAKGGARAAKPAGDAPVTR